MPSFELIPARGQPDDTVELMIEDGGAVYLIINGAPINSCVGIAVEQGHEDLISDAGFLRRLSTGDVTVTIHLRVRSYSVVDRRNWTSEERSANPILGAT